MRYLLVTLRGVGQREGRRNRPTRSTLPRLRPGRGGADAGGRRIRKPTSGSSIACQLPAAMPGRRRSTSSLISGRSSMPGQGAPCARSTCSRAPMAGAKTTSSRSARRGGNSISTWSRHERLPERSRPASGKATQTSLVRAAPSFPVRNGRGTRAAAFQTRCADLRTDGAAAESRRQSFSPRCRAPCRTRRRRRRRARRLAKHARRSHACRKAIARNGARLRATSPPRGTAPAVCSPGRQQHPRTTRRSPSRSGSAAPALPRIEPEPAEERPWPFGSTGVRDPARRGTAADPRAVIPVIEETDRGLRRSAAHETDDPQGLQLAAPTTTQEQAPAPAIRPVPQPPVFEQPQAAAPAFATPPPQTRQQAREAHRRQNEQPRAPAEPSIHVTIGRIEIRASEEREPRARKRDAPSPVMTLDDYLKSRAKR